jgi:O-antigen/teichoic acid export membrane protein
MFWVFALGAVVLYVFFVVIDAFEPGEVWGITIGALGLTVLIAIHFIKVRHELARHGPNEARRSLNKMRERRGF